MESDPAYKYVKIKNDRAHAYYWIRLAELITGESKGGV